MSPPTNFLGRHRDEILAAWTDEARQAASARGLSDIELKNLMPVVLDALTGGEDLDVLMRHIESHLSNRLRWGFEIAEAVAEFAILQRCIAACAGAAPAGERQSADELARIFITLQSIMVRATESFSTHMMLDEQREKRYLRLLRTFADEALRAPGTALTERLADALALVMEAMVAQCGALYLYEPRSGCLVRQAAVGWVDDGAQDVAASLDPASLSGLIAAHDEPTVVDDVVTTELAVGDAFRHGGIHSLLGVRLPQRGPLRGVMYIGTRERRPFSARELRRIEALGEGLTLHLENGELHEQLCARIGELEAERALRERFTAILAHDLRGPLTSAMMSAHLLVRLGDRAEQRPELVAQIERNLDHVDRMLRDLLDISRMHAGQRLPLHIDPCDLREIAEDVARDLRDAHGPRFEVIAEGDLRGMWSRDELRRSLWNLGVNAVKYGRTGTTVAIRLVRSDDGVRLSVHNFGDPIQPEQRAHIFDSFAQQRAAPRTGESWGLGLALVRACAEAHGGAVDVESAAAVGTTFTMTLPLDAQAYQQ